jgi:hypothetical protein
VHPCQQLPDLAWQPCNRGGGDTEQRQGARAAVGPFVVVGRRAGRASFRASRLELSDELPQTLLYELVPGFSMRSACLTSCWRADMFIMAAIAAPVDAPVATALRMLWPRMAPRNAPVRPPKSEPTAKGWKYRIVSEKTAGSGPLASELLAASIGVAGCLASSVVAAGRLASHISH